MKGCATVCLLVVGRGTACLTFIWVGMGARMLRQMEAMV